MNKAMTLLLAASLIGPAAIAKSKGKRKRDPNAPDLSAMPEQIFGQAAKKKYESGQNNRKAGYSESKSQLNFDASFQFITEYAEQCRFSQSGLIDVTLGGAAGKRLLYGNAAAVGDVYKMFMKTFGGDFVYALDGETSRDCTLDKKEAKEQGKVLISEDNFKWSLGVLFSVNQIGKVLDEIGWDKVKVDGIHFTHVNGSGPKINKYNLGCEYVPVVKKNIFGTSTKYYYDIKIDMGNRNTNLEAETIKDCITSHPINN